MPRTPAELLEASEKVCRLAARIRAGANAAELDKLKEGLDQVDIENAVAMVEGLANPRKPEEQPKKPEA